MMGGRYLIVHKVLSSQGQEKVIQNEKVILKIKKKKVMSLEKEGTVENKAWEGDRDH